MNTEQKICELLLECTPNQQDFFKRLYPNMPTKNQQKHAIFQIKNSIEKNKIYSKEVAERDEFKSKNEKLNEDYVNLHDKYLNLKNEIHELQVENAELKLSPSKNKDNTKNLLFLEALQSAGVDNWEGYEFAQEIYEKNLLSQV